MNQNTIANASHLVCWGQRVPTGDWCSLCGEGLWTPGHRSSFLHPNRNIQYMMPCGSRFPIIYKNLVVILLSGAASRKQPTFQRRQTIRWSQFEATGDQLSASGKIISLSLCSVQVPKIIFVFLSQDYLCVFVSLSEDHFCLFHRSKF